MKVVSGTVFCRCRGQVAVTGRVSADHASGAWLNRAPQRCLSSASPASGLRCRKAVAVTLAPVVLTAMQTYWVTPQARGCCPRIGLISPALLECLREPCHVLSPAK